jgi:SlyX protein
VHEKIIDLETKFSFQENLLLELQEELLAQQRQINELVRELAAVKAELAEAIEHGNRQPIGTGEFEKPPHY